MNNLDALWDYQAAENELETYERSLKNTETRKKLVHQQQIFQSNQQKLKQLEQESILLQNKMNEIASQMDVVQDVYKRQVLGTSTGAGVIFGATGGVMEAALRTVAEVLTGKELENIDFCDVRGITGIKEAEIMVGDMPVKVAVVSGTGNAKKLLEAVRAGEKEYHFIEIMACPGGCVNGGGQPIVSARVKNRCV